MLAAAAILFGLSPVVAAPEVMQVEAAFMEAEAMLRLGRIEQARERFQRILDEYPRAAYPDMVWRAAARVRLADIRRRSAASGDAAAQYVAVLEQEPVSAWTSRARLGLAAVVLSEGDWRSAADLLQRIVVATDNGSPDADATAADEARRRLTLIDRFQLRPLLGQAFWSSSRPLAPAGAAFERPVAVAASADGQVLVVDEGLPAVVLVDAQHATSSRLAYNDHSRPWWGDDGLPYLPTQKAGIIALGGSRVGFLATENGRPVPLKDLRAGARTPAGRWYLLDDDPARVLRFGRDGDFEGQASRARERPVDVAVDPRGRLLLLDREAGQVVRFHPDGSREGPVVTAPWRRPEALAVDGLGNIYVLDRDARTIDVFDETGARLARLGPSLPGGVELRSPRDLGLDGVGHVYVADRGASAVYVVR